MSLRFIQGSLAIVSLLALEACAPAVTVADVSKDKQAYLAKNFSPSTLPPDVSSAFSGQGPVSLPFKTLTFITDVTYHVINQAANLPNDVKHREHITMTNADNGYVRYQEESSTNDIPYGSNFVLSYLNFGTIKTQYVAYNLVNAGVVSQPDKVSNVTKGISQPQENNSYGFDEHAYDADFHYGCQTGKFYAANTVLPKLTGKALDADCMFSKGGNQRNRSKVVYLSEYGIYVTLEVDTSTTISTVKIIDITAN